MSIVLFFHNLDRLSRRFWWNVAADKCHYSSPIGWYLCYPKKLGGLGNTKFYDINMAYLIKLAWQLEACPSKLWVSCFKAKNPRDQTLLRLDSFKLGTWIWKGIVGAVEALKQGY